MDTIKDEYRVSEFSSYWQLDPEVIFLNHGSFGACPIPVLEAQAQFWQQLEREPVRFFVREYEILLDQARNKLAEFVGADGDELVFLPNATTGINTVLRSLAFSPQDELLTTNHEYNACRNALNFVAERWGAKVVVAEIPFPMNSPQEIIDAILACVSPRTKLALIDHVTSQTALVFPIQEIVQKLKQQGIDTLIDGAHAPGMVPLNLQEIGATYYAGNCHKWLCAPKGAAFLYVQRQKQTEIHPLTISHGANSSRTERSRFLLEFDWMGTDDPSAYLSVPVALKFMNSLMSGGWKALMQHNHKMVLTARELLCKNLGLSLPCPNEMLGSMAVLNLPDESPEQARIGGIPRLQDELWEQYHIEVPIIPWPTWQSQKLRISCQIYNTLFQYEVLGQALTQLLGNHNV